jgi:hypothetical protein
MWFELQRLTRENLQKKSPAGGRGFFAFYGRFLRGFRKTWCKLRGFCGEVCGGWCGGDGDLRTCFWAAESTPTFVKIFEFIF